MLKEKLETILIQKGIKNVNQFYDLLNNDDDDEEVMKRVVYQVLEDLNQNDEEIVLKSLKEKRCGWNHKTWNMYQDIEYEQDCFIIQPFEIVEGIVECRCGSKRVFSYSKQTRSGDESITTFNECLICKNKWVYNG